MTMQPTDQPSGSPSTLDAGGRTDAQPESLWVRVRDGWIENPSHTWYDYIGRMPEHKPGSGGVANGF